MSRFNRYGLRLYLIAFLCASVQWLSACSHHEAKGSEQSDKGYFTEAMDAIKSHNYQSAIHKLQDLDAHYPVGPYTEQSHLELIYANMMHLDYAAAGAAADRFIHLHPGSNQLDYAYYAKGLADFKSNAGAFDRYFQMNTAWRDLSDQRNAFEDFRQLLSRFPQSRFAADARQHMIYIRNQLAEGEIHVALYYARRGAYLAALNRARNVVEGYSQTTSVSQALAIMSYCYDHLNMKPLADSALSVLRYNDPQFRNLNRQGRVVLDLGPRNDRRSWFNIISFGLMGNADEEGKEGIY